jgi:hypothetical protein
MKNRKALFTYFFWVIMILVFSCKKKDNTNLDNSLPVGTTIKYEAIGNPAGVVGSVAYTDGQQNSITQANVPHGWTHTFQTTRVNQHITLSVSGGGYIIGSNGALIVGPSNITGRIYINGLLKKEANGLSVILTYP